MKNQIFGVMEILRFVFYNCDSVDNGFETEILKVAKLVKKLG